MAAQRVLIVVFVAMFVVATPAFAQRSPTVIEGPIVIPELNHDTGPLLREIEPLFPEFGTPSEREIENNVNPNHNWSPRLAPDPVLQTKENSPRLQTPNFSVEFDGIGYGDEFFCNCMPPDNDGAPGTTQYVQYVNTTYQVFDKQGRSVLGTLAGKDFWSGFKGPCQSDNSGDPILRFDAMAQRWVVAQFAITFAEFDYECVAVSTTDDATGSYYRYAFPFKHYPDYPKFGVWPDAYYFTFNNFNMLGTSYVGANVCAADRSSMLTGAAATLQCFQQDSNQFAMLPADLDGSNPPAAGTPNFVMELDPNGSANLSMFQFHVDFTTPANSTFTGPTVIPVAPFTPLCPTQYRGRCVPQPTSGSDVLESLGDRIMYRLVYRNFGDHTTLLASHSIAAGASGGVRWYEIRDPETSPTLYQSGTFAPDSEYRWMPSIAMDHNQDIAVGYSRSSATAGDFPSVVYAGRMPTDPAGTLESEVVLRAGEGSQKSDGGDRWGDYSSMTVDPTDDCTFWFTEEYLKSTGAHGGLNWSTAVGAFRFPGCIGASAPAVTVAPISLQWGGVALGKTGEAKSVVLTNSGNAQLNLGGILTSGDFALAPVSEKKACGSTLAAGASCTIKVIFVPSRAGSLTGHITITDNAASSPQSVPLSGTGKD